MEKKKLPALANNLPTVPERLGKSLRLVKTVAASPLPAVITPDPETINTLTEHYAEGLLHIKRSTKRYRGNYPKKGYVWYFIDYQIENKGVYAGAYEMNLDFETYLINKGEGWVNKFLFSELSKELAIDNDVDLATVIKEHPNYGAYQAEMLQIKESLNKNS